MIVIIAGSRSIKDYNVTLDAIAEFQSERKITEVVCGMADGPDIHGKIWAEAMGIPVKEMPVLPSERWAGGPNQRNQRMADYCKGKDSALLLVWDGVSSGSMDMLKRAKKVIPYIMVVDLSQPRLL